MNKEAFKSRVLYWCEQLETSVVSITVRPMTRKWASCSTNGRLNFSGDVLALDDDLCDYVIVHELLHLSVPNHGKLWKALMMAHIDDYQGKEIRLQNVVANQLSGVVA